jgi:hypothetical protein
MHGRFFFGIPQIRHDSNTDKSTTMGVGDAGEKDLLIMAAPAKRPKSYSKMQPSHADILTVVDKVFSVEDLLTYIMQFVTAHDKLVTLRFVCKEWNNAVCDPASWHSLRLSNSPQLGGEEMISDILEPEARPLLAKLRTIDLTDVDVTDFDFRCTPLLETCKMPLTEDTLTQVLKVLPRLTDLFVQIDTRFTKNISEPAAHAALANMSKLRSLKLFGYSNWDRHSRFAQAFAPSLQSLESYEGVLTIGMMTSLTKHCPPRLHSLIISTEFEDSIDVAIAMRLMLEAVGPQLTGTLHLVYEAYIYFDTVFGDIDALRPNPKFDVLKTNRKHIDALPLFPQLTVLKIDQKAIQNEHCSQIARHCPALTTLRINWAAMDSPGLIELAKGIPKLATLYLKPGRVLYRRGLLDGLYFLAECPHMRSFEIANQVEQDGLSPEQSHVNGIRERLGLPPLNVNADFTPDPNPFAIKH